MVKAGAWSSGSGQAPWLPMAEKQVLRQPLELVGGSSNPNFHLMPPGDFWVSRLLGRGLSQAVLWEGKCFGSTVRKSRETAVWGALSLMQGVPTNTSQRWSSRQEVLETPGPGARRECFCKRLGHAASLSLTACRRLSRVSQSHEQRVRWWPASTLSSTKLGRQECSTEVGLQSQTISNARLRSAS